MRFLRTSTWIVRALPVASGCLDLGGLLARERDLLLGSSSAPCSSAGSRAARLVLLGQRRRLRSCRRPPPRQLLEQRARRQLQLLANWATSSAPCASPLALFRARRQCRVGAAASAAGSAAGASSNQGARAFMMSLLARSASMPVISISSSPARSASASRVVMPLHGEHARDLVVHALDVQQVLVDVLDVLLARDRLGEQRVARAAAQLVHRVLVERLDLEHLVDRHVGDLLERGEAFADQDVGDFLVDVELLHEELAQPLAFLLVLLLRLLDGHEVELPAGELGGEAHVLAAPADRDARGSPRRPRRPCCASPRRRRSTRSRPARAR